MLDVACLLSDMEADRDITEKSAAWQVEQRVTLRRSTAAQDRGKQGKTRTWTVILLKHGIDWIKPSRVSSESSWFWCKTRGMLTPIPFAVNADTAGEYFWMKPSLKQGWPHQHCRMSGPGATCFLRSMKSCWNSDSKAEVRGTWWSNLHCARSRSSTVCLSPASGWARIEDAVKRAGKCQRNPLTICRKRWVFIPLRVAPLLPLYSRNLVSSILKLCSCNSLKSGPTLLTLPPL